MKIENLNEEILEDISKMLKALSDPTRLKIMQYLHDGELCVGDIVDYVGTGQANISKHLKILSQVHLLKSRREGQTIYYSLYHPCVKTICESVCEGYSDIIKQKFFKPNLKGKKQ